MDQNIGICRLCSGETNSETELFHSKTPDDLTYSDLVEEFLQVSLYNDMTFPNRVCWCCMVTLNAAKELKRKLLTHQLVPEISIEPESLLPEMNDEPQPSADTPHMQRTRPEDSVPLYPHMDALEGGMQDEEEIQLGEEDPQQVDSNFLSRLSPVDVAKQGDGDHEEEEEEHRKTFSRVTFPVDYEILEGEELETEEIPLATPPPPPPSKRPRRTRPPRAQTIAKSNQSPVTGLLSNSRALSTDTCGICNAAFLTPHHLAMHLREQHLQVKRYHDCAYCGQRQKDKAALVAHEASHKYNFACKWCPQRFASKFGLANHLPTHTNGGRVKSVG